MGINARHYRTANPLAIDYEAGRIVRIETAPDSPNLPWIAPAFCDVQINGCDQISFNADTLTHDQIRHVVSVCRQHGIAQFMPTLVTTSSRAFMHGFRTIREACDQYADLA